MSDLRASDAEREAAAARLRIASQEGRLDVQELDARLAAAYRARWCSQLDALIGDVTPIKAFATGTPGNPYPVATNGFAIAALVAALGVLVIGPLGALLAIAFGHIGLVQIRRARRLHRGRALAVTGLVIGYGYVLLWLYLLLMLPDFVMLD